MKILLVGLFSALIVLVLMPLLIRYMLGRQFGQTIYKLGPQAHLDKQGTPNMGGILIGSAAVTTSLAFALYEGLAWRMLPLQLAALGCMAVGFLDDYIKVIHKRHEGLKPRQKVLGQVLVGVLFSVYCYFTVGSAVLLPFTAAVWDLGIWYVPLMTVLVVFMTNSANIQDGADGLLSSVTVVGGTALSVFALLLDPMVAPRDGTAAAGLVAALVGACLGFLYFNRHPAKIIMGDTGSMFIGGVFVAVAMLLGLQLWLVLLCFTMIASSLSVVIQRVYFKLTKGKRIFRMSPIHHHFELSGMSENQIVTMYTLVTLALSALAVVAMLPLAP